MFSKKERKETDALRAEAMRALLACGSRQVTLVLVGNSQNGKSSLLGSMNAAFDAAQHTLVAEVGTGIGRHTIAVRRNVLYIVQYAMACKEDKNTTDRAIS